MTKGRKKVRTYRVTRRELVEDVYSSGNYQVGTLQINPGLKSSFPWLSTVSRSWEKYKFHKLHFEYSPLVTQYAANASGRIMLLADYDALDSPPQSKQTMLDSEPVAKCVPAKSCVLRLNPRELNDEVDWRFIRKGSIPPSADLRLYDVGQLYIGRADSPTEARCGELWVDYDVEFSVAVTEHEELLTPRNVLAGYGKRNGWNTDSSWQRNYCPMNDVGPSSAADGFVYEAFDLQGKVFNDELGLQPGFYLVTLNGQATGVDFEAGDGIFGCTAGLSVLDTSGNPLVGGDLPLDETRHYSTVTHYGGLDQLSFSLCFTALVQPSVAFEDGYARLKPYIQAKTATPTGHLDITYDLTIRPI